MFQSLAGTQAANEDFGVSKEMLDEAFQLMAKHGTSTGPNQLYFETGQGSEVSLDAHLGIDMQTLEARTYGYARHWKPFMVNNVSGFIGPETIYDGKQVIRADLEDLLWGKCMGSQWGLLLLIPIICRQIKMTRKSPVCLPHLQEQIFIWACLEETMSC